MSQNNNHLSHTTWECKYHLVFTPKYRKRLLFSNIRPRLGSVFRDLARRKECQVEEGQLMPDHVHMLTNPCIILMTPIAFHVLLVYSAFYEN